MISILKKTIAISALLIATGASAQVTTVINPALNDQVNLGSGQGPVSGSIEIANSKSRVIQFDRAIGHSLVANPAIADLIPMTDQSLYILGKQKGTTSLTLFDKNQNLLGVFDLNVSHDLAGLKQRLYQLAPNERIEVRSSGNSITLSGEVSDPSIAHMAAELANQYAPGQVLNTIATSRSHQVMLSVKIAEVQRSASKALGLNTNVFYANGADSLNFFSGALNPASYAQAVGRFDLGDFNIQMLFDALEEQGVLTTLAEPTLVAISGETANFLAGGEFPVPVSSRTTQDEGTRITIEFKEFGVKLAYTPTVIGDTINLVVEPEVSVLDPANGIQVDNLVIPGLVTRRAHTTIDLKNGQSFAIAGLLQESFEDNVSQIPGLGKIPIIGALARSSQYTKRETELLIVVTPYLVEPHEGSEYNLPTDNFTPPTEGELFFGGNVEGAGVNSGASYTSNPKGKLASNAAGNPDGNSGYIVK